MKHTKICRANKLFDTSFIKINIEMKFVLIPIPSIHNCYENFKYNADVCPIQDKIVIIKESIHSSFALQLVPFDCNRYCAFWQISQMRWKKEVHSQHDDSKKCVIG